MPRKRPLTEESMPSLGRTLLGPSAEASSFSEFSRQGKKCRNLLYKQAVMLGGRSIEMDIPWNISSSISSFNRVSLTFSSKYSLALNAVLVLAAVMYYYFRKSPSLPPGPFRWPLVGSLFSLENPLMHHFAKLSTKYGPIIYLKLGQTSVVVANSPDIAKLFLKVHDAEFAHRPHTLFYKEISNGYKDLIFAPYGESWRRLKKISVMHLFSPAGLDSTAAFRRQEIKRTLRSILQQSRDGVLVNMKQLVSQFSSNVMCLMLFGKQDPSTVDTLMQLADKIIRQSLNINVGEVFPVLDFLDLHGVNRRMKNEIMPKVRSVLSELIEQHRRRKLEGPPGCVSKDFTDVLLSLEGDEALPEIVVISILLDMVLASIETSQTAIEWIMAELMNSPEMLLKAQAEVDQVSGKDRLVKESELSELPYIQAIVKEALRLHPPAPLGVPHMSEKETIVAGYRIPAMSKVFINIWALGRDPSSWNEPETFKPERFLNSNVNLIGQNYEFIPFSAGRRMCTGFSLALRSIPLVVATLVQAFDWKPALGQRIDLTEVTNLTVGRMAKEVTAVATPRLADSLYA